MSVINLNIKVKNIFKKYILKKISKKIKKRKKIIVGVLWTQMG
jgi:hypothetical protein